MKEYICGDIVTSIREGYECRGKILHIFSYSFLSEQEYEIEPLRGSKIKSNFVVKKSEIKEN